MPPAKKARRLTVRKGRQQGAPAASASNELQPATKATGGKRHHRHTEVLLLKVLHAAASPRMCRRQSSRTQQESSHVERGEFCSAHRRAAAGSSGRSAMNIFRRPALVAGWSRQRWQGGAGATEQLRLLQASTARSVGDDSEPEESDPLLAGPDMQAKVQARSCGSGVPHLRLPHGPTPYSPALSPQALGGSLDRASEASLPALPILSGSPRCLSVSRPASRAHLCPSRRDMAPPTFPTPT